MKRVLIGLVVVSALAGVVWGTMSKTTNVTSQIVTLTSVATGSSSTKSDTIWLNRAVEPDIDVRDYSGFRSRIVVGPLSASDTTALKAKGHGFALTDSILVVVKKKLGPVVSLIDSTAATAIRLLSASKTLDYSFFGSGATDTLNAQELFMLLRVADTASDTAGVTFNYPVQTFIYYK